jgi:hypothetical protein
VSVGDVPVEEVLLLEDYFRGTTWPAAFNRATPGQHQFGVVARESITGICIVLEKRVVGDAACPRAAAHLLRSGLSHIAWTACANLALF